MPWKSRSIEASTGLPPVVTRDGSLALVAALIAFVIYILTIYPGLFGMGDAAKFAFVGKVLGTPHAPGYPLYMMVSHLFSYVPLGTLAYRMNVLSAILGAAAVAVLYLGCRTLGARQAIAFATALAFAFGRAFWSKAQYPKGYSLNALLVSAGILLLLHWGRSRRPAHLYGAIGVFALASGNHLIIVALVPALVLYALFTNIRQALAPRTIAVALVLIALGLSQYTYILIRTHQGAPYLEARASNISELVSVMTARRYSNEIGAYGSRDLKERRIPTVARLITDEMTRPGLLLAAVGVAGLCWRRRWQEAMLCGLGAFGVAALTSTMSSNEDEGFLLPAFALLWLLVAAGAEAVASAVGRLGTEDDRRTHRVVTVAIAIIALLLPAEQLLANYRRNDHSRRTFEIRYYAALFDALPDRSAIVLDQYNLNMLLYYKLLGEGAARGRDIIVVPQTHEDVAAARRRGFQIYAFNEGRGALSNFGYQFEAVELFDVPLPRYLDEVPDRWTVVIAATPAASRLLRDNRAGWRRLGATTDTVFAERNLPYAFVGSTGGGRDTAAEGGATVTIEAGTRLGPETPVLPAISANADGAEAWIVVDGVERVRARNGAAIAVIDPAGRVEAHPLDPRMKLRVPFSSAVQTLYRVTRAEVCQDVGNTGWRDLSDLVGEGRLSLVINNYRPFLSRTVVYASGPMPMAPAIEDVSGRGVPELRVTAFDPARSADRTALQKSAAADGLPSIDALLTSAHVARIEIAVNDEGDQKALRLAFGAVPATTHLRTTVDLDNPKRAIVCGAEPAPDQRR